MIFKLKAHNIMTTVFQVQNTYKHMLATLCMMMYLIE